jgi:CDP-diacylglycerol--glycerol-3-phosphate 3-phosphatidyltransferase
MSLTFANKITVGRILAVPFLIAVLLYYSSERDDLRYVALAVFLAAVVTDVIDGYIARTRHQKTRAGAILDPLADKLLLISSFVCLYAIGPALPVMRFPIWLVVAVISRDVILLLGAAVIFMIHGDLKIEVSFWGKATTFFQILSAVGMLLQWPGSAIFWSMTFIFTIISGIDYIRQGIRVINVPSSGDEKKRGF